MTKTIKQLAKSIVDQAGEIGVEADGVGDDAGIQQAQAIRFLCKAQRAMSRAKDAIRLAALQARDEKQEATA